MIYFGMLRYRNFLSSGDNFTEIDLSKSKSTLVVGANGSGKSTMLDAISFALFGKSHRNINKPQLTNSINEKNCEVELHFSLNGSEFIIIRGLKPARFEIYKDGVLLNQTSHNKEYQKQLEQNILKLNHKTFHQVVVLGASSFVPFMQLPALQRREVIEDLLDINLFSKMNTILKEKVSILKTEIASRDFDEKLNETKIEGKEKYIADLERINTDFITKAKEDLDNKIQQEKKYVEDIASTVNILSVMSKKLNKKTEAYETLNRKLLSKKSELKSQIRAITKDAMFYDQHDNCPSCHQEISGTLKTQKLSEAKSEAKELEGKLESTDKKLGDLGDIKADIDTENDAFKQLDLDCRAMKVSLNRLRSDIDDIKDQLSLVEDEGAGYETASYKQELVELYDTREALTEQKHKFNERMEYHMATAEMLKDTGIKTKIIKQYLPVINSLVNKYLQVLDFFVHFNFDGSFSEIIKSRHRDDFSYESFSQGEKQRIDLSLLFTWRQIAKMKNSVSTNLLILDETFDSSLDQEGVDNLLKILETLEDGTNTFVISHKGDMLEDKFEDKIEFVKDKNFSRIKR